VFSYGETIMHDPDRTRFSLLVRLKDTRDHLAWAEFVEIYTPVVYGFLRRRGLQHADAEDVTQEVFATVGRSIAGFQCDQQKGSFRAWLMTVVRSRLIDHVTRQGKHPAGTGDTATLERLEEHPARQNDRDVWEEEYRKSVFEWAAGRVREEVQDCTWQAFWRSHVCGEETKHIAEALEMSEGAVYVAKHRVLARLRKNVAELEGDA